EIVKLKEAFEVLEKRRQAILKSLEEQEVLTPELQQKIHAAEDLIVLEDLYLPFKRSRKTKADAAREKGLESLAKIIMAQGRVTNGSQLSELAKRYINQHVESEDDALEGARHI